MSTMLENASEVLFVLGILFTVAGVIFREIRRAKDPYKGRAVATVVELAPGKPDRAGKEAGVHDYYYPVMTFYASNGRLIRERYRKGSNPPAFRVGEKVPVRYDAEKPERFTLNHPGKEEKGGTAPLFCRASFHSCWRRLLSSVRASDSGLRLRKISRK